MQRTRGLVLSLLVGLLLGGCGSSSNDDEDSVKTVVSTYLNAFVDGNGDRACDQLTGDAKRHAVDAIRERVPELNITSCTQAIETLSENAGQDELNNLKDVEFETVTINGEHASARPKGASTDATLTRTSAGWLISSLGF
jgi:hypothetical protein